MKNFVNHVFVYNERQFYFLLFVFYPKRKRRETKETKLDIQLTYKHTEKKKTKRRCVHRQNERNGKTTKENNSVVNIMYQTLSLF